MERRYIAVSGGGGSLSICRISSLTLSVAVAVTAITGTDGYSDLKKESCLNEGRKS